MHTISVSKDSLLVLLSPPYWYLLTRAAATYVLQGILNLFSVQQSPSCSIIRCRGLLVILSEMSDFMYVELVNAGWCMKPPWTNKFLEDTGKVRDTKGERRILSWSLITWSYNGRPGNHQYLGLGVTCFAPFLPPLSPLGDALHHWMSPGAFGINRCDCMDKNMLSLVCHRERDWLPKRDG